MSKQKEVTQSAIIKGYLINKDGKVFLKGIEILGSYINKYKKFNIRNENSETHPVFFHRLQGYEKFGNLIFEEGIVVRHLNGNPSDNSWDNIQIGSASDNQMDRSSECRKRSATIATRKMQDNARTHEERCKIYEDLKNKIPYSEIMKKHNISSKGTLSFMKNKSIEYKEYINGK